MHPDDGCFVQAKHVAAIAFVVIKFVCRQSASLLLRDLTRKFRSSKLTDRKSVLNGLMTTLHCT